MKFVNIIIIGLVAACYVVMPPDKSVYVFVGALLYFFWAALNSCNEALTVPNTGERAARRDEPASTKAPAPCKLKLFDEFELNTSSEIVDPAPEMLNPSTGFPMVGAFDTAGNLWGQDAWDS